MSKHRVRAHRWVDGILSTFEHLFDNAEDATSFASSMDAHVVKVYDPDGNVISSKQSTVTPDEISTRSYA